MEDNLKTEAEATTGQDYDLTFNFVARNDGPQGTTDGFGVYWNGDLVGSFDPTQSSDWESATIQGLTGIAGTDTLEIRETGANDAYGALIDNVKLVAQCNCNCDLIV